MALNIRKLISKKVFHKTEIFPKTPANLRRTMVNENIKKKSDVFTLDEIRRFITDCVVATGCKREHALLLADNLTEADYRGHSSNGLNMLEIYLEDIESGACRSDSDARILKETPTTAWVDGCYNLGVVVAHFCMGMAINKAKKMGIGWVTCKGSNDFGMASYYSLKAHNEGLIGFACCNSPPVMVPTRGKQPMLGPNPISLSAPASKQEGFILDMSTAAISLRMIDMKKHYNSKIPENCAVTKNGEVTTDPFEAAYVLPLGGQEISSGYKGYGLSFMVEILCGILGGGNYGPHIRKWRDARTPANLCQTFFALDPEHFAPDFKNRLHDMMETLRSTEAKDSSRPVLVAGDTERQNMKYADQLGGIQYLKNQLELWDVIALKYGVTPLRPKEKRKCL